MLVGEKKLLFEFTIYQYFAYSNTVSWFRGLFKYLSVNKLALLTKSLLWVQMAINSNNVPSLDSDKLTLIMVSLGQSSLISTGYGL